MAINNDGRLVNTTTCLPLAYGSVAFYLGKKSDEFHTHRWTLYVRSPDQAFDLSRAISKVVFQLHPSFPQPTRELNEPPFEVTETGWGEFEASIRIVWKEVADERSTIVSNRDNTCKVFCRLIADFQCYSSQLVSFDIFFIHLEINRTIHLCVLLLAYAWD